MKPTDDARFERVIKRYENRKLYDVGARRYITLDRLGDLVAAGDDVRVVDQRTGHDLTAVVLAQVLLEGLKQRKAVIPHQVLSRLIRLGLGKAGAWVEWSGPAEAAARARDEAERIVSGLLGRGRLTIDDAVALRDEMTGSVQRIVQDAQHGIEARLRSLVERSESEDGVNPSLHALRARLLTFESLLAPAPPSRVPPRHAGKPKTRNLKRRK